MRKSVNEVKKEPKISHRPKTLECVKKSCVYRWQNVPMQGIYNVALLQNKTEDLSAKPIPQEKKSMMLTEKIHGTQAHTHTSSQISTVIIFATAIIFVSFVWLF